MGNCLGQSVHSRLSQEQVLQHVPRKGQTAQSQGNTACLRYLLTRKEREFSTTARALHDWQHKQHA